MNLQEIQKRMDSLQKKSTTQTKSYDKANYWKAPKGEKSIIRIVPYKYNKDNPFTEVAFHYNIAKYPLLALTNFDESDPIVDFAYKLKISDNSDDRMLGKKLLPKSRYFVPVIVRGEEEKGVRFWEFGSLVYKELLGIVLDEDYGDISNIENGRDITIEVIPKEETGKKFDTTTVRAKPNQSPLHKDPTILQSLLDNQHDLMELYNKPTFDEIKSHLEKYLMEIDGESEDTNEMVEISNGSKGKTNLEDQVKSIFS